MPASLGPSPWPDCGTLAASRRHYRRREPCCEPCRQANARDVAERDGHNAGAQSIDRRPFRNDLPFVPYVWRARRYPWAQRVLARSTGAATCADWSRLDDELVFAAIQARARQAVACA